MAAALALVTVPTAHAAVQLQSTTTTSGASDLTSVSRSHTTPPGTDRFLVVTLAWDDLIDASVTSIDYGGNSLTCHGIARGTAVATQVCTLAAPPTGTHDLNVTWDLSILDHVIVFRSFTGVHQTSPVEATATATGSGTVADLTIATNRPDATLVAGVVTENAGVSLAPRGGLTEDAEDSAGIGLLGISHAAGRTSAPTSGSYAVGWDLSSSQAWAIAAVELRRTDHEVSFDQAASSNPESTTSPSLGAALAEASNASITVGYAVTGGTATGGGTDYALADGTLTIPAGATSASIDLDIVDDGIVEPDESIEVTLSSPSSGAVVVSPTTHTYTIEDDDVKPTITNLEIFDTTADGLIDQITITFSANIDTADGAAPVAADFGSSITLPDGSTADLSSASFTDPAGTSATVTITGITGQATANTAIGATGIAGDLSANWKDSHGNALVSTLDDETVTDSAKPSISSITTLDRDEDGNVDAATVVFTEAIDDATLTAGDWSIGGQAAEAVSTTVGGAGDADDDRVQLQIITDGNEVSGTDAKDVTYTQGTTADLAGNLLATTASGDVTEADGAAPVPTAIESKDTGSDGQVDRIDVTYSETLSGTAEIGDYTLGGTDAGSVTLDSATISGSTVRLSVTGPADNTGLSLTLEHDKTAGTTDSITDGTNPAASFIGATVADAAKPTITDLEIFDTDADGLIDKISITFTENIDTDDGTAPVAGDLGSTITLPDGSTADLSSATITDPAGTSAIVTLIGITGQATKNTATGSTSIAGDLSTNWADGAGNALVSVLDDESVTDSAAPIIVSIATADTNANGKLDQLTLVYSEPITTGTVEDADFSVGTANGLSGSLGASSSDDGDDTIQFAITEGTSFDTDATPTLTYAQDDGGTDKVQDASGNLMSDATSDAAKDGAAPIQISIESKDIDADGQVDRIDVTYSEPLSGMAEIGDYTLGGTDAASVSLDNATIGGSTVQLNVTGPSDNTGLALTLDYDKTTGTADNIGDDAGNAAGSITGVSVSDGAAPQVVSITTRDTDGDGNTDAADITFTEPIDDSTIVPGAWAMEGAPFEAVNTTVQGDSGVDDEKVQVRISTDADEISGTDAKDVTYTQGTTADLAGNLLADVASADVTETDGAEPTVTDIEILDRVRTVSADEAAGSSFTYEAAALDGSGNAVPIDSSVDVAWSVEPAQGGSFDGNVLTPGTTAGLHTIRATYVGDADVDAVVGLRVIAGALASLDLTPSDVESSLPASITFEADGFDAHGNRIYRRVAWSLSGDDVGGIERVGPLKGRLLADEAGVVVVKATHEPTGISADTTVTLLEETPPFTGLAVAPGSATVVAGEAQFLTAVASAEDGSTFQLGNPAWSVADRRIGSINDGGRFVANKVGTTQVTAASGGLNATAELTVVAGSAAKLIIAPASAVVGPGVSVQFEASAVDARGNIAPAPEIDWRLETGTGATLDADGTYTAGDGSGASTVTAAFGVLEREATVFETCRDVASQGRSRVLNASQSTATLVTGLAAANAVCLGGTEQDASVGIQPPADPDTQQGGGIDAAEAKIGGAFSNVTITIETQPGHRDVAPEEIDRPVFEDVLDHGDAPPEPGLFVVVRGTEDNTTVNASRLNEIVAGMTVRFRVPISYFETHDLDPATVRLAEWEEEALIAEDLAVALVSPEAVNGSYRYEARLERFSAFSVLASPTSTSSGGVGGGGGGGGPPSGTLELSMNPTSNGYTVHFDAELLDQETPVDSWGWHFYEGATADVQYPVHRFPATPASYTVTLHVRAGHLRFHETLAFDLPLPNRPPVAGFTCATNNGCLVDGLTVTFVNTARDPDTDDVLTAAWDLGDGTTSTAFAPTHTYDEPGRYLVTQRVHDGNASAETTRWVEVEDPRRLSIDAGGPPIPPPDPEAPSDPPRVEEPTRSHDDTESVGVPFAGPAHSVLAIAAMVVVLALGVANRDTGWMTRDDRDRPGPR